MLAPAPYYTPPLIAGALRVRSQVRERWGVLVQVRGGAASDICLFAFLLFYFLLLFFFSSPFWAVGVCVYPRKEGCQHFVRSRAIDCPHNTIVYTATAYFPYLRRLTHTHTHTLLRDFLSAPLSCADRHAGGVYRPSLSSVHIISV